MDLNGTHTHTHTHTHTEHDDNNVSLVGKKVG